MLSPYENWAETNLTVNAKFGNWWRIQCLNPEHGDAGPNSAQFNIETGGWHCFACGSKGSVANNPELSIIDTRLAATMNRLQNLHKDEQEGEFIINDSALNRYAFSHPYWYSRGLNDSTIELFELGYDAIADAVTIPVRNFSGALLGVTRRFLATKHFGPRYMYPKHFKASQNLFASWLYDCYDMRTISVHEGAIDAMRLWQLGIPATALYGSAISEDHVQLLLRMGVRRVVYFGDSDKAGQRAKERAKGFWVKPDDTYTYKKETDLSQHFALLHVTDYNNKKDAGDMTDEEIMNSWQSARPYTFRGFVRKTPRTRQGVR